MTLYCFLAERYGQPQGLHSANWKIILRLKIKHILFVLTFTVCLTSCSKTTPAGFWTNFYEDLMITKNSDQGPWGGHREIHWRSKNEKTFNLEEIIDFASKNGWQLTDSLIYANNSLSPLTKYPETDYSFDILRETVLKQIASDKIYIFVFTTGWTAVEPGNARDTEKNGFVIINSKGTQLMVYHLWGE